MSKPIFKCPHCGAKTLSVDDAESVLKEGVSDPKQVEWLKQQMAKSRMKGLRFWRCEKCDVYYQTDPDGKLIKELRFPSAK